MAMAEKSLKLGQRVEVTGKDVKGIVAYVGSTMFSNGKWIGIILDEPKGKNNGTVQGRTYFQCPENYGMFVRQSQLTLLDEAGTPVSELPSPAQSGASSVSAGGDADPRRSRLSGSRLSLVSSRSQGEFPTKDESGREASTPSASEPASKRASFIEKPEQQGGRPRNLTVETQVNKWTHDTSDIVHFSSCSFLFTFPKNCVAVCRATVPVASSVPTI